MRVGFQDAPDGAGVLVSGLVYGHHRSAHGCHLIDPREASSRDRGLLRRKGCDEWVILFDQPELGRAAGRA